jgi:hypothetical protein
MEIYTEKEKLTSSLKDLNDALEDYSNSNDLFEWEAGEYDFQIGDESIDYKHNEVILLEEMKDYIDDTYDTHYSGNNGIQPNDLIEASGNAMGFYLGNVIKYGARYGKKAGYNRQDIIKIIHYGLLALNAHDTHEVDDDHEVDDEY